MFDCVCVMEDVEECDYGDEDVVIDDDFVDVDVIVDDDDVDDVLMIVDSDECVGGVW